MPQKKLKRVENLFSITAESVPCTAGVAI